VYDVLIVGGGPAGLSAAMLLGRCRRSVLLCDEGRPRNAASRALHGYLGRDGVAPLDLLRLGRAEVRRYGIEVRRARVTDVVCHGRGYRLRTSDGRRADGRYLILATGMRDALPPAPGFRAFYGRGVFHCPYCDGWEHRDAPLAAYAPRGRGAMLALKLLAWSRDVVLLTDGRLPPRGRLGERLARHGVRVEREPLARLEGDAVLRRVVLGNGRSVPCRALFFQGPPFQASPLAERLGCAFTRKGAVRTGPHEEGARPRLYVVGDASHDVQFVIIAAAEGTRAAYAIHERMLEEERA
jgi:thioredoxin reductase